MSRQLAWYNFLTVHNKPPMLEETVYDFEGLRSGGTSFVQSESGQPLEDSLDLILAKNFLYEFLCVASVKVPGKCRISEDNTHSIVPV
jgi:hypothetical protein